MTPKIAAFAPMPIASDSTATTVKPLALANPRHTWRTSIPMPLNNRPNCNPRDNEAMRQRLTALH